jgi:hypothetical protein
VTFDDVRQCSGILPDLAGFSTERDSVATIAEKIAAAVLVNADDVLGSAVHRRTGCKGSVDTALC